MVVNGILLALLVNILYSIRIRNKRTSCEEHFSIDNTTSIKGFSIIMIMFSHIVQYEKGVTDVIWGGKFTTSIIFSWGAIGVSVFFLLSGYGCYFSANREKHIFIWTAKHIIRLICHFIVAFFITTIILMCIFRKYYSIQYMFYSFVMLRILNTSTWYLKIQIMMYLVIMITILMSRKFSSIFIVAFLLLYAIVAKYMCGFSDFWWKTAMCFAAGYCIAKFRSKIFSYINRKINILMILTLVIGAYFFVRKDISYHIYVQLPAYVCIALGLVVIWCKFIKYNIAFKRLGKYTLDIYLVHIGIVETVFSLNCDLNIKVLVFILNVALGTILSFWGSEKIYKLLINTV